MNYLINLTIIALSILLFVSCQERPRIPDDKIIVIKFIESFNHDIGDIFENYKQTEESEKLVRLLEEVNLDLTLDAKINETELKLISMATNIIEDERLNNQKCYQYILENYANFMNGSMNDIQKMFYIDKLITCEISKLQKVDVQ